MGQSLSQNRMMVSQNRISIVPKSDTIIKIIIKLINILTYNHSIRTLTLKSFPFGKRDNRNAYVALSLLNLVNSSLCINLTCVVEADAYSLPQDRGRGTTYGGG